MSLRSFILDHLWLKFFSLVLATLIWLAVSDGLHKQAAMESRTALDARSLVESTRTLTGRPIQILAPLDHGRAAITPDRATVILRGPDDLLQALRPEDVDVFVRLSEKLVAPARPIVQVRVPAGASVVSVIPLTVQLAPVGP